MDKLRAMETFVRIVETGSLTAASETLGLSPPAVVRALAALEREVGVRLLHRTTRRSSLSDEGREYYERCRRVLAEVEAAEASLRSRRAEPKGRLRVTAPVMFGRLHVAPVVTEFLMSHACIEVELTLLDRVVDLVEEGIDVAFRIGDLPESSLVAVSIGETRRVVCASPEYLRRAGTPGSPADLARHRCIVFSGLAPGNQWAFAGKPFARMPVRPVLRTNQFDVAMTAVRQGVGCAQFLAYQVEAMLAAKQLKRILPRYEPEPVSVQVVYPHARLLSPNVRAFVDLAVERLRPARRRSDAGDSR
jgi:DNA-binding transcriptional LysR family regulator